MSSADRTTIEAMGAGSETVDKALKFIRQARTRTGPGSGHELGELSTGLVPICGLLASESLTNDEITRSSAWPASCLNKTQFNKAYQILQTVLEDSGGGSTKRITCDMLLKKYVLHPLMESQLNQFCQDAMIELKELGMRPVDLKTTNVACGIFLWVCTCAKVQHLPSPDDLASDYRIKPSQLHTFISKLSKELAALKRKIAQQTKGKPSATPSPTKSQAPSLSTPRRSGRPKRELPSMQSGQKQNASPSRAEPEEDDEDDMPLPETPSKKRRLDPVDLTARKLFESTVRGSSSSKSPLEKERLPATPKTGRGSPLKQTITLPDPDVEMRDAEEVPSECEGEEPKPRRAFRRFRPVFFEQKQWSARDPRLKRIWRLRDEQKQKLIELHGHPFQSV